MPNDPSFPTPSPSEAPGAALSAGALARRHALLKGLGKGAAVAAAAVPIQTLAAPSILVTGANTLCTLSGQMSNVMSRALSTSQCSGYKSSHYVLSSPSKNMPNDWPQNVLDAGWTTFNQIFVGSSDTGLLIDYLAAGGAQGAWIAAYFNATHAYFATKPILFPYTPAEVVAQYQGTEAALYLQFYLTHLSGLN